MKKQPRILPCARLTVKRGRITAVPVFASGSGLERGLRIILVPEVGNYGYGAQLIPQISRGKLVRVRVKRRGKNYVSPIAIVY
jgi:hypothetical protein